MKLGMLSLLCLSVLSGCAAPNTAFDLMREQQQAQMTLQEQEARRQQESVATEDQVYLASIRRMQEDGQYYAALAHLSAYEQRFGMTPEVSLLRADALRFTGQAAESEAIYRQLLLVAPSAEAWRGLGLLAAAAGDFVGAGSALDAAASLAPVDAAILSDLGYARLQAGQPELARIPLAQAAELEPTNPRVLANFALLLAVQGQDTKAQAVMAKSGMSDSARQAVIEQASQLRFKARVEEQSLSPQVMASSSSQSQTSLTRPALGEARRSSLDWLEQHR